MNKIQKILLALIIAGLVAAGAGSVYLERNVFHIQGENGKEHGEPMVVQQPLYRLKIEDCKDLNMVLQERVELITIEKSENVNIIAQKGYGSKEEIASRKINLYDASAGKLSRSPDDYSGVIRIDNAKYIFQTISTELISLEIANSEKVSIILIEYVDVIRIQKSEDVRIVARKGYGCRQIVDSKRVEINGTARGESTNSVITDAGFSDSGYHAMAVVSSGQITYQEEIAQDSERHDRDYEKCDYQSDSGLVQDSRWYASGSFNRSREITVWNDASVNINSYAQTGDWQNQGSLQAGGSGRAEQGVTSDNYIYQWSRVAITPAP